MKNRKALSKAGLIVVIAVSLFVCPLATGGYGLGYGLSRPAEARQIEFTPHVATLEAEATPQTVIGPHSWTIGEMIFCPRGHPERCRPDLATSHGDSHFGFGEIAGSPGLYLVWVTDSNETRYLVVQGTDAQLQGETLSDDYSDILQLLETELENSDSALGVSQITGLATGIALSLLPLCPLTWGAACIGAAMTLGVSALIAVGVSENGRAGAEERARKLESNLLGRFDQLVLTTRSSEGQ